MHPLGRGRGGAGRAAAEAAARHGRELGRAALLRAGADPEPTAPRAVLDDLGYEPYEAAPAVLRLGNCPFHPVAAASPELVCGLNVALIGGVLTGLEAAGAAAVLAPRPGECCVEIRTGPPPG